MSAYVYLTLLVPADDTTTFPFFLSLPLSFSCLVTITLTPPAPPSPRCPPPPPQLFVFYSDHGAAGVLGMPTGPFLYADEFIKTLKKKHSKKGFKEAVL